ncbi:hypothetical protein AOLI_G00120570 [Acnodon oligacanthus]
MELLMGQPRAFHHLPPAPEHRGVGHSPQHLAVQRLMSELSLAGAGEEADVGLLSAWWPAQRSLRSCLT